MLMQKLLQTYRDLTRQLAPAESVTTVSVERPAANANRWVDTTSRQRRQRRLRRSARVKPLSVNGWSVKTW